MRRRNAQKAAAVLVAVVDGLALQGSVHRSSDVHAGLGPHLGRGAAERGPALPGDGDTLRTSSPWATTVATAVTGARVAAT